jgi:putative FmdB family regulatory protein
MPTYEYKCTVCDDRFEIEQKFTDDPLTSLDGCPVADDGTHRLKKIFSAIGIAFKGEGFYRNDARVKAKAKSKSSSDSDSTSSGSTSSGSTSSTSSAPSESPSSDSGPTPKPAAKNGSPSPVPAKSSSPS